MDSEILRANLEALLFVSEEPQSVSRLAEAIPGTSPEEVQDALDSLMREYTAERFGIQLVEIAGGYQLCTKGAYSASINKLFERRRSRTLSKPALETLAIIAYRQPITRAEIEIIRGVNVDGVLHSLLERRLVKISGRKEIPGRPFLYRTTKSFLQYFGLKSLADLPKVDDITHGLQPLQEPEEEQPDLFGGVREEPSSPGEPSASPPKEQEPIGKEDASDSEDKAC